MSAATATRHGAAAHPAAGDRQTPSVGLAAADLADLPAAAAPGCSGCCVLVFFALVAVFAPLLASPDGLEVTKATGGVLQPPSAEYPLGTDDERPLDPHPADLGDPHLVVRRAAGDR